MEVSVQSYNISTWVLKWIIMHCQWWFYWVTISLRDKQIWCHVVSQKSWSPELGFTWQKPSWSLVFAIRASCGFLLIQAPSFIMISIKWHFKSSNNSFCLTVNNSFFSAARGSLVLTNLCCLLLTFLQILIGLQKCIYTLCQNYWS